MDGSSETLLFYPGENENALKQAFIDACVRHHKNNFTHFAITEHIFKHLKEPYLRALQAAQLWGKDLEILEAIQHKIAYGEAVDEKQKRVNLLMSIAEDTRHAAKDRIAAILGASSIEGEITKAVEKKITYPNGIGPKGLPNFFFTIDEKSGDEPEPETDDIEEENDA